MDSTPEGSASPLFSNAPRSPLPEWSRLVSEFNPYKNDGVPAIDSDLRWAITKRHGVAVEYVPEMIRRYIEVSKRIPQAPDATALTEEHARLMLEIEDFTPDIDKDWFGFVSRMRQKDMEERDANNPYLPRWDGKTDDRPTVWADDTGPISDKARTTITSIIRQCSPSGNAALSDILQESIIKETDILASVLESLKHFLPFFVQSMGDNEDFRWTKSLCTLAGLGLPAFRFLASEMAKVEDDWGFYAECSDKALTEALVQARWTSGYPFGLLRADFQELHDAIQNEELTKVPHWWAASLLLHILKHTRYYQANNGKPQIYMAYKGRDAFVPLTPEGVDMPLNAATNQSALIMMNNVLRIPTGAGKKKKSLLEIKASSIFNFIKPSRLTYPLDLRTHSEMIYPKAVITSMVFENKDHKWIDPGILIRDTATIDVQTGVVETDAPITGPYALSLAWPFGRMDPEELANWKSNLPKRVDSLFRFH